MQLNNPPVDREDLKESFYVLMPVLYEGKWYVGAVSDGDSNWMIVRHAETESDAEQIEQQLIESCWTL